MSLSIILNMARESDALQKFSKMGVKGRGKPLEAIRSTPSGVRQQELLKFVLV